MIEMNTIGEPRNARKEEKKQSFFKKSEKMNEIAFIF